MTLVDDARLEIVRRVATRAMLPGAPRRSPDGRHAYVGSTDGWITKLDLRSLAIVTEVRAGLELRDFALSSDGRWLLAGNAAPHSVAIFDADLRLVKTFAATPRDAATTSRVAAVADAAPRSSFVVVLQDIPEIWEISYDPRAEDIYDGLVHDYRMGEGVPMRGFLNRKRSLLGAPLDGRGAQRRLRPRVHQRARRGCRRRAAAVRCCRSSISTSGAASRRSPSPACRASTRRSSSTGAAGA